VIVPLTAAPHTDFVRPFPAKNMKEGPRGDLLGILSSPLPQRMILMQKICFPGASSYMLRRVPSSSPPIASYTDILPRPASGTGVPIPFRDLKQNPPFFLFFLEPSAPSPPPIVFLLRKRPDILPSFYFPDSIFSPLSPAERMSSPRSPCSLTPKLIPLPSLPTSTPCFAFFPPSHRLVFH